MNYTLTWRPAQQMDEIADQPFDVWREDDGEPSTCFYRTPDGFLLRFLEGADFQIRLADREVICTPLPEVSEDYARNIFSNQILPLVWTYDGSPVLHASCVVIDGWAYGFLGPSGRGKSTLAAAFARHGHAFLTDDGMVIERNDGHVQIRPYLPSIRLTPESQSALFGAAAMPQGNEESWPHKSRIEASSEVPHAASAAPLRAIYVLQDDGSAEVRCARLPPSAGLDALLKNSFLLDSRDKQRIGVHFRLMAELTDKFPMYALDYPRDFDRIAQTVAAIAAHAKTTGC